MHDTSCLQQQDSPIFSPIHVIESIVSLSQQGGIDLAEIRPGSLRYSIFGRVKKSIAGWHYRCRLDTLSTDLPNVRGIFQSITPTGCILLAEGFANPSKGAAAITSVNLEQPFRLSDGFGSIGMRLPIERAPPPPPPTFWERYVWSGSATPPPKAPFNPSVTLRYSMGPTGLILTGNSRRQSLTLNQRVGSRTFLTPTIATDGTWQVGVTQNVGSGASVNAVVRPGDSVTLSFGQYPLMASVVVAGDGRGATFFVKRSVPAFS